MTLSTMPSSPEVDAQGERIAGLAVVPGDEILTPEGRFLVLNVRQNRLFRRYNPRKSPDLNVTVLAPFAVNDSEVSLGAPPSCVGEVWLRSWSTVVRVRRPCALVRADTVPNTLANPKVSMRFLHVFGRDIFVMRRDVWGTDRVIEFNLTLDDKNPKTTSYTVQLSSGTLLPLRTLSEAYPDDTTTTTQEA